MQPAFLLSLFLFYMYLMQKNTYLYIYVTKAVNTGHLGISSSVKFTL